ncbi:hypothetical protein RI367_000749 [Sorochytrium milnesiophthora]
MAASDKPAVNPQLEKIQREIAIMKKCIHPNVVRLMEVIDDPASEKVYMILEYVDAGEIPWQLEQDKPVLDLDTCRNIFRHVIVGLHYLHAQGIIHRDIKPANLLWTSDQVVKVSDFGVSHFSKKQQRKEQKQAEERRSSLNVLTPRRSVSDQASPLARHSADESTPASATSKHRWRWSKSARPRSASPVMPNAPALPASTSDASGSAANDRYRGESSLEESSEDEAELSKTAGSPAFFAPELCLADELELSAGSQAGPRSQVGKAIDVWALGVTLYCFVFGRCPFMAETEYELFDLIPVAPVEFPEERPIDDDLKDLFLKLLEKDPDQRITLAEAKEHPWTLKGLSDAQEWIRETDPALYSHVQVTDEEIHNAFSSLFGKLRRQIRRLSNSFHNLSFFGKLKRRTQSMPSVVNDEDGRPATAPAAAQRPSSALGPRGSPLQPDDRLIQSASPMGPHPKLHNGHTSPQSPQRPRMMSSPTAATARINSSLQDVSVRDKFARHAQSYTALGFTMSGSASLSREGSEDASDRVGQEEDDDDWDPEQAERARQSTWSSEYVDSEDDTTPAAHLQAFHPAGPGAGPPSNLSAAHMRQTSAPRAKAGELGGPIIEEEQ